MPVPDLGGRFDDHHQRLAFRRGMIKRIAERMRRNRRAGGDEAGLSVTVDPDRPLDLTGGAAAALEFDE